MQDAVPSNGNDTPDIVLTQRNAASPLPDHAGRSLDPNTAQGTEGTTSALFAGGRRTSSVGAYLAINRNQISALRAEDVMKRSTTPVSEDYGHALDHAVVAEETETSLEEGVHMPYDSLDVPTKHIHFSVHSPVMTPATEFPLESPFPRSTATSIMELNPNLSAGTSLAEINRMEMEDDNDAGTSGKIASLRGAAILAVTATAQLMDLI
ncbi:hypothetical protein QFC22_002611 [Naganishia vaughanmartiniae]|uniref:Uncharacterized protein n=1 Tax=Naganishia vaughanmartiniae TaxID=1424756 RepID=A0ACC2XAS1_9TREE|nr:hypothetical protein QFC22_002611 [Naganishia vaughanmartiniae]